MIARRILYIMLALLVVSPSLAMQFGVPRLDTMMSYFVPLLFLALISIVKLNSVTSKLVLYQFILMVFGFLSIFSGPENENLPDIFLLTLPMVFLLLLLKGLERVNDPLGAARALLIWLVILVILPVYIELASGFKFTPNEIYNLGLEGSFKGMFFNPNDMTCVALMLLVALFYFYSLCQTSFRQRLAGRLMITLTLGAIVVGGSRTALLTAFAATCTFILIRTPTRQRTPLYILAIVFLISFTNISWIEPIILWATEVEQLEYTAKKIHLALFLFDTDNSISYRNEIITYFFENFRFIFAGFGPRNYGYFFQNLSDSLGAKNPHAYLIEVYLAYGLFGFLAILAFFGQIFLLTLGPESYTNQLRIRQKQMARISIFVFLIASFVPSSIFRIGIFWFPLMLIVWHQIYTRKITFFKKIDLSNSVLYFK